MKENRLSDTDALNIVVSVNDISGEFKIASIFTNGASFHFRIDSHCGMQNITTGLDLHFLDIVVVKYILDECFFQSDFSDE